MTHRNRYVIGAVILLGSIGWISLRLWFPAPQEPGYQFMNSWGSPGNTPGEFHEPIGIAVAQGKVFVSDAGNNRIQVFDENGGFLRQFGRGGSGVGDLDRPMHIVVHNEKLYVAEYLNDRLQIFTFDGESLGVVGSSGSGSGQLDAPGGVAVASDGRLYVADFYNHRVQFLSPDGEFIRQVGTTGDKGIGTGLFNYPTDVALLPNGDVVVADAYNDRIQVFSSDGTFLRKWGGPLATNIPGPFHGWFKTATGVAVGPEGNVFVADFYNHRIQKFTPEGEFLDAMGGESLGVVGSSGSGSGQLDAPGGVAVASDGRLYVADFYNHRVQFLSPDGEFIRQVGTTGDKGIGTGLFNYPTDVALLPNGDVVVADAYNDRIQVFSSDGTFLRKWGGPLATNIPGPFHGWFKTATGVAVGPEGNVFVAD